jgi:hypothetical protein
MHSRREFRHAAARSCRDGFTPDEINEIYASKLAHE